MVLIRGGKKASLAAALDGLQGGLQSGFGMGQQMRRTQLAEREQQAQEERYKQSVALASQAAALDAQREGRYADEQKRNNARQDAQDAGTRELTNSRIDSITPEQTAAGAPQLDGIGPAALSKFGAGLMQHHDRVLKHAKATAKNLPPDPAMHAQFWGDVQAGLQNDQQNATLAKMTSDLEGFGHDANTELGGGPVQDLMGEAGDGQTNKGSGALGRFSELKGLLQSASSQNPMLASSTEERQRMFAERQKIINLAAQGIGQTHDQLRTERVRRNQVASVYNALYPKVEAERAHAMSLDPNDPLSAILMARADDKDAALSEYLLQRMDYSDFQKRWSDANKITLPTGRRGTGAGEGGGPGATDPKSLDRDAAIRKTAAERADKAFEAEQKKKEDDPTRLPWESIFAREYKILGGRGEQERKEFAGHGMDPFKNQAPGAAPINAGPQPAPLNTGGPSVVTPQEYNTAFDYYSQLVSDGMSAEKAKAKVKAALEEHKNPKAHSTVPQAKDEDLLPADVHAAMFPQKR